MTIRELNRTKKNIGYQTVYQVITMAIPIITSPYLSRVLGASQLGVFSFTLSIANYFVLFSLLGTEKYGARSVAASKACRETLNSQFTSIFSLQSLSAAICLLVYILYVSFICSDNRTIAFIQTLEIIGALFNISWLYYGTGKFKETTFRSLAIKLLSAGSIFVFVNTQQDLWKYALISGLGTVVSNLILWCKLDEIANFARVNIYEVLSHLKPSLMLFIPIVAMSIYHVLDKTMLGIMSDYQNGGYYYNVDKVINIPMGIISGISVVMLPKFSEIVEFGTEKQYNYLFSKSLILTLALAIFMTCGIVAIAREFVPVFFGEGYEPCVVLIQVLAIVVVIKTVSFTIRYQYLIPKRKEKQYIASVLVGAIVDLIANLLLIPRYGAMGAVIGTVLAELSACIVQIIYVRNEVQITQELIGCVPFIIIATVMIVGVRLVRLAFGGTPSIVCLMSEILVGIFFAVGLALLYLKISKNPLLNDVIKITGMIRRGENDSI